MPFFREHIRANRVGARAKQSHFKIAAASNSSNEMYSGARVSCGLDDVTIAQ